MTSHIIKSTTSVKLNHQIIPFLSILGLILLISVLNIPVMETLWRYSFDDGTYSHAYLIPFIVGYLYFLLYQDNALKFRQKLSWSALILFIASNYLFFVTTTAQISIGYWIAILLLLCSSINFLFQSSFKVLFPASYFIFILPLWGGLVPFLQPLSVHAVNAIMSLTPIPVFVEHQFVHIPEGVFEIAGGCSGLRYLITSLAISSLFIFLYLRNIKNIFIFSVLAIFGALFTNWLRIVLLIIIGHETNMTSSLMTDHNMFGWYLYIPFMFLLFKLGNYLIRRNEKAEALTQENTTTLINLNILLIIATFILLVLSSTTLKRFITPSSTQIKTSDIFKQLSIKPRVHEYSSVKIVSAKANFIQLIYGFNGNNLEAKPTFYDNHLIPVGWTVLGKKIVRHQEIFQIKNNKQRASITISYGINGKKVATVNKFKIQRIKQALVGNNKTRLYWAFKSL